MPGQSRRERACLPTGVSEMNGELLFGPAAIGSRVGHSERNVRRYLRERFPRHIGWWKFSQQEFDEIVRSLQSGTETRRYVKRRPRRQHMSDL